MFCSELSASKFACICYDNKEIVLLNAQYLQTAQCQLNLKAAFTSMNNGEKYSVDSFIIAYTAVLLSFTTHFNVFRLFFV